MKNLLNPLNMLLLCLLLSPQFLQAQVKTMSGRLLQTSEIDQFLERKMEEFQVPGISLAIVADGKVVYHTVQGVAHTETQKAIDKETLFEGASITKPVFAYLVMKLVEQGKLDLDRPLYLYRPYEAISYDDRYKKITARIVLTHRSGFPNWRFQNKGQELDIRFEPGTEFSYSGEGFVYLSKVVEHICQKRIDVLLQEEVFEPLGMNHSYMMLSEEQKSMHAQGHFNGSPTPGGIWMPKLPNVASSIRSEAHSFSQFLIALMEGKGLRKDLLDMMLSEQVQIPEDHVFQKTLEIKGFGLGFGIESTPFGEVVAHGGNNNDFQSYFQIDRKRKLGYVFFTNSNKAFNYNDREFAQDFSQQLEIFLQTGEMADREIK